MELSLLRRISFARLALRGWWHPSPAALAPLGPPADIHLVDAALHARDEELVLTIPHRLPARAQRALERELGQLGGSYGVAGVDLLTAEPVEPGRGPGWFVLRLPNLESVRDYRALPGRLEHALSAISFVVVAF